MSNVDTFFAEKDSEFRGRTRMNVRAKAFRRVGPYALTLESSCGTSPPHVKGSARIFMRDTRNVDNDVSVKRFSVDSWREATDELDRLATLLRKGGHYER